MVISDEQLMKFQKIYKNYYGKEIDRDKAYGEGLKLISVLKLLCVSINEKDLPTIEDNQRTLLIEMLRQNKHLPI